MRALEIKSPHEVEIHIDREAKTLTINVINVSRVCVLKASKVGRFNIVWTGMSLPIDIRK